MRSTNGKFGGDVIGVPENGRQSILDVRASVYASALAISFAFRLRFPRGPR